MTAPRTSQADVRFRHDVRPADVGAVRAVVKSTDFFRPDEIAVAAELVEERLAKGDASGYFFVFVDDAEGAPMGYACFGPIPCTLHSASLYWIAVRSDAQGRGLGNRLMLESERRMRGSGLRRVYVETSGQPRYEPTRGFYERSGYSLEARLRNFYDEGDDKLVYVKRI
ncbi:MAG: GNAT family N-acetyltransferase [Phycisphaeraceae bacterium]|nr:GNAT family N-acetyltransferase [Phycisphaeraceae bacterium]